jgi:hypothetical protein
MDLMAEKPAMTLEAAASGTLTTINACRATLRSAGAHCKTAALKHVSTRLCLFALVAVEASHSSRSGRPLAGKTPRSSQRSAASQKRRGPPLDG